MQDRKKTIGGCENRIRKTTNIHDMLINKGNNGLLDIEDRIVIVLFVGNCSDPRSKPRMLC